MASSMEKEYNELRDKMIRIKALRDDAKKRLLEEFECSTIKEAKQLLASHEASLEQREKELREAIQSYREQFDVGVDGDETDDDE